MSVRKGNSIIAGTPNSVLNRKANTDLNNLTRVGKNIANWSNNITNCITEIPQDIKLELNAGTLTLKAGSKIYKADGTYITTTQDYTTTGTNADAVAFYDIDNNVFAWRQKSECYSQASAPTNTQYMLWFDTTNNIVKVTADYGTTWSTCALPVGIFTADSTKITSIDRVFNGIGYIGQSVFSLPGIKGLIPNGKNEDGTLKNTEFTTTNVYIGTAFSMGIVVNNEAVCINSTGVLWQNWIGEYDHEPAVVQYAAYYNSATNKMYFAYTATEWTELDRAVAGFFSAKTGGVITDLKTRQPFRAVDYNDSEYIANCAMPSNKYVNLTLGAIGATYTAPADGWFYLRKFSTAANEFIGLYQTDNDGVSSEVVCPIANFDCAVYVPARKGQVIACYYTMSGATAEFRFVYAQGAK